MLEQHVMKGAAAACAHFGLKLADVAPQQPSMLGRMKNFGMGQLDAGKALLGNVRGGLGGASPHMPAEGAMGPTPDAMTHRAMAVGNLKTLAPSLLAGGGLYMLHRHRQQQEEQARQQAMMQGYGAPM